MALTHDHTDPPSLPSVADLHLENIFDDIGVSGKLVDEMLALERDTLQRCLGAGSHSTAAVQWTQVRCPFCVILPLQLTCRPTVRLFSATFGSDSQMVDRKGRP